MRKSESTELIRQAFVLSVASVIQVGAFEFIYEGAVEIYEAFFRQLKPVLALGCSPQSRSMFWAFSLR